MRINSPAMTTAWGYYQLLSKVIRSPLLKEFKQRPRNHSTLGMLQRKLNPWNFENVREMSYIIFILLHTKSL